MIFGDKVRLRAIERDDLPRYVEWFNDPEVRETLMMYMPMSQDDEVRWYESMLERNPLERPFAIDGLIEERWVHIGSCGVQDFDTKARKAEVGISIGEKRYWNQGYGTEAMRTLIQFCFNMVNLNRVFLRVYSFNERALHVYKKLGFQEEGRLRADHFHRGDYHDTIILGILRSEWQRTEEGED
jgi:RimJ/RimL family protein N-acetyltransferase